MSDLNWYSLDPIDLLLMREAKPFSPGDGSWAKSQFPPLPTTVFQAMRSATPWRGNDSHRQSRDLEFVGPFLYCAPPDRPPSLWLPTPQDLLCVKTFNHASDHTSNDDSDNDSEEDITKVAAQWERTARLQSLDRQPPAWAHLGFDPDCFPKDALVPMVPPMRVKEKSKRDLNTYLRMIDKDRSEGISGRPQPWMRADALIRYLKGDVLENLAEPAQDNPEREDLPSLADYFWSDPWTTQVLPHIKMQPGTRQVAEEEGYFTEVAIRLKPHWYLVAGISADLEAQVVRLGGEGHRALVSRLDGVPPCWAELAAMRSPTPNQQTAYVLTPGLAEIAEEYYGLIPSAWNANLQSCVGDRALLWGGMSVFQKPNSSDKSVAFQPQRAFVPPGTVYRFKSGQLPDAVQSADEPPKLLPSSSENDNWLKTLNSLNYGLLLWGQ